MFLTVFYAAATWVQSRRLADLHTRILQLTSQNGSVVLYKVPELINADIEEGGVNIQVPTVTSQFCENNDCAKLGDLLWNYDSKRLCSVFPKQSILAGHWIKFSSDCGDFPICVEQEELSLEADRLHVLIEADYQFCEGGHCLEPEFCKLEKFGLLRAWKAGDYFGILLETDAEHLTRLGLSFMQNTLSLEDGMEVLRIQTVDVRGKPCPLLNADSIAAPRSLPLDGNQTENAVFDVEGQFNDDSIAGLLMSPVHWRSHVELLQSFSKAVDKADGSVGLLLSADRVPTLVPIEEDPPTPPSSPQNASIPSAVPINLTREKLLSKLDYPPKNASLPISIAKTEPLREIFPSTGGSLKSQGSTARAPIVLASAEDDILSTSSSDSFCGKYPNLSLDPCPETTSDSSCSEEALNVLGVKVIAKSPKSKPSLLTSEGLRKNFPPMRIPSIEVNSPPASCSPESWDFIDAATSPVASEKKSSAISQNHADSVDNKSVSGITSHSDSFYSCASQDMGKLTESLEQLNKALSSITDETTEAEEAETEGISPLPPMNVNSISNGAMTKNTFKGSTASLPSSLTPKSRSPTTPIKCPNVLVYSDQTEVYESIKSLLRQTLKKYRYTMYNVNAEQIKGSAWQKTTALVVIHGNIPENVAPALISFLVTGGKVLCIASNLIFVPFPELKSCEVQLNELGTFSYQKWKTIRLLHHIYYKAPTLSTSLEMKDSAGYSHKMNASILSREDKFNSPNLIMATMVGSGGKILFSQVHLEVDAKDQQNSSPAVYAPLKESNAARIELARELFTSQLNLECSTDAKDDAYSAAYFLGRHEFKLELLAKVKPRLDPTGTQLSMDKLKIEFCGKNVTAGPASDKVLPCYLHSCPPHFNTVEYFDTLSTEHLGRLMIYSDVLASSMDVLTGPPLWHGLAAVTRVQLQGKGRSNNEWLSPEGCAMFSLQLVFPSSSILGQKVSLIQHIAALAVCVAIREAPEFEDVDLRLKWPNDIYAGDYAKMGGLIANSSFIGDQVVCNIGLGFNLTNSEPTTCLQDLLLELKTKAAPMSLEKFLALTFNRLESLINLAQSSAEGLAEVLTFYHAYWLHSGKTVTVQSENGKEQQVKILGLDPHGYLQVQGQDGKQFSVHPDGNSFDMLQGLIKPKDW